MVSLLSAPFMPIKMSPFLKVLSYLEQANGFSPVWVLKENFGEKTHHCKQCDKKWHIFSQEKASS